MSKRAPLRLVEEERAEFAVSSLMFLSVVLVSTSILSTFLLAITERTMVDGRESADQQADVINGIVSLRFLELSGYDAAIADDELHFGFEMPYLIGTVEDVDVRWVLLCSDGAAGTAETVAYSTGDFEEATSITGTVVRRPTWISSIQVACIICSCPSTARAIAILMPTLTAN